MPMMIMNRKWINYFLIIGSILTIVIFIFTKHDSCTYDDNGLVSVTLYKFYTPLLYFGTVLALICWVLILMRKKVILTIASTLIFAILFAYCSTTLAPWIEYEEAQDAQGEKYCFLESSFLQGQALAIGHVFTDNLLIREYAILVRTNGDSPRSYIPVLRQEQAIDSYGQLYCTSNQWLVGIRYENQMYMAYDLKAKKAYGHAEIGTLSPFVLIDKDTRINNADVTSIGAYITGDNINSQEQRKILTTMPEHPNSEVWHLVTKLRSKLADQHSGKVPRRTKSQHD